MRQQLRLKNHNRAIYEPCLVTGIFENGARRYAEAIAEQYNTTLLEVVKNLPFRLLCQVINSILSGIPSANGQRHHVSTYYRCNTRI